jgi:hypothetical protein
VFLCFVLTLLPSGIRSHEPPSFDDVMRTKVEPLETVEGGFHDQADAERVVIKRAVKGS